MEKPFNRRDIGYTIFVRFEETVRHYISDKLPLFYGNFYDGIPKGIIKKVENRVENSEIDCIESFLDYVDFIDLTEIICFNNKYASYFPNTNIEEITFREIMLDLYSLRNKIMHLRMYFTSYDHDNLIYYTTTLINNFTPYQDEFNNFLSILKDKPESVIIPMPATLIKEMDEYTINLPNNIPVPDYEYEGGFVGREKDLKAILNLLGSDLHRVITISGAGGVGKTALALKTLHTILGNNEKKFNGIVWLSAKEKKLSVSGIDDIEPSLKNYEELLDKISSIMGFKADDSNISSKESHVKTIFDLHDNILIVIDNLEAITDERIINFILDSHPKVKILITSRKGLGQVERRYELKQLTEKEAIYLFRLIARDKKLDYLAKLDDKTINKYVQKLAYYPLAIKWILGNVANGKDIDKIVNSINESTSDISEFCFDEIYNYLSDNSKKMLCALSTFDEAPSAGVLKYVVNLSQKDFEDGISELVLVSLIIPEQFKKDDKEEISTRYSLLSLTKGYVQQQLDKDSKLKRDIEERLKNVLDTIEEADRAKKQYRFSLSNLGATTEEEKIAAMLAITAFQKYQAGNYDDAYNSFSRASEIAPNFGSLYRNWAVMESQEGHHTSADKLIAKASKLNPDDPQIWFVWGNIYRNQSKIKDALDKYLNAHKFAPEDVVILNALGQARSRLGEYEEADKLYHLALSQSPAASSIKHEIINKSSIADNLARWSAYLIEDRNYTQAEEKLLSAYKQIHSVISYDLFDEKSQDLYRKIVINLGYLYKKYIIKPEKAKMYFIMGIVENPKRYKEIKDTMNAATNIMNICLCNNTAYQALKIVTPDLYNLIIKKLPNEIKYAKAKDRFADLYNLLNHDENCHNGKIISLDVERGFTIIESLSVPGKTYLGHFNSFISEEETDISDIMNKKVKFLPKEYEKNGKLKREAVYIRILNK